MDHFIDRVKIQNFKSIRELEISGCKRINLFIGRPNVGKSNILEALSVFSIPYVWVDSKLLTSLVRLDNYREVFFDGDIVQSAKVGFKRLDERVKECQIHFSRSVVGISISLQEQRNEVRNTYRDSNRLFSVDSKFRVKNESFNKAVLDSDTIKSYHFKNSIESFKESNYTFLLPPLGSNLLHVLELNINLRKQYAQWFRQYGLRLVLDTASQSLKVQKEKGEDEVFQLPYSSVADTLQRIIFYKTAVASNENSVLLFEEPEAHAFPPYIVEFTQEVIQSLTNQFFIVTHSPLIVEEFLTNAIDELGIFNVDFKDGQTVVRPLTTEEIYDVRKYGVDLFFNNEAYLS